MIEYDDKSVVYILDKEGEIIAEPGYQEAHLLNNLEENIDMLVADYKERKKNVEVASAKPKSELTSNPESYSFTKILSLITLLLAIILSYKFYRGRIKDA